MSGTESSQAAHSDDALRRWTERRRELLLLHRLERLTTVLERLVAVLERRVA